MKTQFIFIILFFQLKLNSQETKYKGSFYFYWGYNREFYSKSDIRFMGNGYDFTLSDVKSHDRQSKLAADPYLHVNQLTIPQYNYRLGYYINNKYSISMGFDHMKYVMNQNQVVRINGFINGTSTSYDKIYSNENIELVPEFLEFEHTDGLNYINVELNRNEKIYLHKKGVKLNVMMGASTGIVYPRTRVVLLNKSLHDQWHVSGYGATIHTGINIEILKHFFVQDQIKVGYLNMPSIVTTYFKQDRAKQQFSFLQNNVVLGYRFKIGKTQSTN